MSLLANLDLSEQQALLAICRLVNVEGIAYAHSHLTYHAALHTPPRPSDPLWCQLAYFNYTALAAFGAAALTLESLRNQPPPDWLNPKGRLRSAQLVHGFLSHLGSALDALTGSIVGLTLSGDPLARRLHFFSLSFPSADLRSDTCKDAGFYGNHCGHFRRRLAEFNSYRNFAVHTVAFLRDLRSDGFHLVRLDTFSAGSPSSFVASAFQRIYGTDNPTYGGTRNVADYQLLPVDLQLQAYFVDGVRAASILVERFAKTYSLVNFMTPSTPSPMTQMTVRRIAILKLALFRLRDRFLA